jgi:hypothetical protein
MTGTEAKVESRGSILRYFIAGKSPIAFKASILMHFMHKSAVCTSVRIHILNEGTFFTIAGAAQMFWVLPMPVCLVVEFHKSI